MNHEPLSEQQVQRLLLGYILGVLVLIIAVPFLLAQQQEHHPVVNDDSALHDEHKLAGTDRASEVAVLNASAAPSLSTSGAVRPVLTRSYDNLRSGATRNENKLTISATRNGLRKLFSVNVPGDKRGVEAQPLIVPNVRTIDGVTHDLLVLSSMANVVAAFDANDGTPLWLRRLAPPVNGTRSMDMWMINEHWGVLSTGVIKDEVLYVVSWSSLDGSRERAWHRLYEISLVSGQDIREPLALPGGSSTIQRKQRSSLTLVGSTLFIPSGTIQETADGAHGFITVVDTQAWKVLSDFNLSPNGKGAGLWQAGQGLVVDSDGFLYGMTGNGTYNGTSDFGESFIKLRFDGVRLSVVDHYSPFKDSDRPYPWDDTDLGSGGPSLIPELQVLFGGGKDGIAYVLPWRKLSSPIQKLWYSFYPGPNISPDRPIDTLFASRTHHLHSSSVTWKGPNGQWRAFCWGENGNLRAWRVDAQGLHFLANGQEVASTSSPTPPGGMPGGFMSLSSNDDHDGILWATVPIGDANRAITTGYLIAYDATTFTKYDNGDGKINTLWRSDTFVFNKFLPPVVSGGRIYVGTYDGKIDVYGL